MKPLVAAAVILVALASGAQAQTPEIDALRARAEQGDAEAQNNLGGMYDEGRGVPQDDAEAVRWYRLAAEQGFAEAQFSLWARYADGAGVPQDYVQAHMWTNLWASRMTAGEKRELAVKYRDALARLMTPDQLAEAHRLAREWDAAHPARTSSNGAKLANGHRNLQFGGQDYRSHVQGVVIMVQNWVGEHARAQLGAPLRQGEQR